MLKKLITLSAILLFVFKVSAQEVPEIQSTLITKITATWCTFCGTWGWDAFENIYDQNRRKAIVIANHYSGDLRNNTAITLYNNLGGFGQPLFYVNNANQGLSSGNWSSKLDGIRQQVDVSYGTSPTVNAGLLATLDGNNLTIKTKTRFFKAAEGEYYLAIYAIENGVINFQQSRGANASHKNVLRGSIGAEAFGKLVVNGTISSGTEFDQEFSGTIGEAWNIGNTSLATVIWKKEGDVYRFVNGFVHQDWQTTTNTDDQLFNGLTIEQLSSITNDRSTLVLNLEKSLENVQFILFDPQGKAMDIRRYNSIPSGRHQEEWSFQDQTAGTYIIQLVTAEGSLSRKVIVQK